MTKALSLRFPDAPPLRVFHGSPRSHWEPLSPLATDEDLALLLAGVEETTIVAGHTHLWMDRCVGARRIFNPGSVGGPVDGLPTASYLLLDGDAGGWEPTFRRVAFDLEPLLAEFARQRFVDECGAIGQLVIDEFRTNRLQIVPFLHWRAACCPHAPLTLDLLDRFALVDKWAYTPAAFHLNRDVAVTDECSR